MTSSVALAANVAPVTSPSTSDASSNSGTQDNFSQPLQQARQQYTRPGDASRPAHTHAHSHASSTKKNNGTQDDTTTDPSAANTPAAATAAMLALLNQSVPASAAASPVSTDADDAAEAVTTAGTSGVAAANAALLGATQAVGAGKPAVEDEFTKAMDGVTDKSLTMFAQGADDDGDTAATPVTGSTQAASGGTFADALQALGTATTKSNDGKGSDSLDALKNLATAMTQQAQPQSTTPSANAPHVLTMQSSVDSPSFGQELSQQVTWLGGQDVKEARIRLHPEDMGELDVKVSVKQDHVDVAFIAQHPQAVHAVQQTLTQLDTMLAHHGLSLGQTMVGQGNAGNGSSQSGSSGSGSAASGGNGLLEDVGEVASVVSPVAKAVGLVDMFV